MGIQWFEWNIYNPQKWGLYCDIRSTMLPVFTSYLYAYDKTDSRIFPIESFFELRTGTHFLSRDKYNMALGINPFNVWIVKQNNTNKLGLATLGMSYKFDFLIADQIMFRYIFALDVGIKSDPKYANGSIITNDFQIVFRNGFFVGTEFKKAFIRSDESSDYNYKLNRFDMKFGFRFLYDVD